MFSAATWLYASEQCALAKLLSNDDSTESSSMAAPAAEAADVEDSTSRSMSAHLCLMAWKDPIGRPNCTRTLAYSTDISSTFCAPPPISFDDVAAAWSGVFDSAAQPAPGSPSGDAATSGNS